MKNIITHTIIVCIIIVLMRVMWSQKFLMEDGMIQVVHTMKMEFCNIAGGHQDVLSKQR